MFEPEKYDVWTRHGFRLNLGILNTQVNTVSTSHTGESKRKRDSLLLSPARKVHRHFEAPAIL
jgi:hypothetical protein